MSSNQLKGSAKFIKENSSNWGTAILREKKSGNFGNFGHGKPGKVREFHLPQVLTTLYLLHPCRNPIPRKNLVDLKNFRVTRLRVSAF